MFGLACFSLFGVFFANERRVWNIIFFLDESKFTLDEGLI